MVRKKEIKLGRSGLRKDNFIYKNFKVAVRDIGKIKSYFWFSFFLFFFIGLVGYMFPVFFESEILKIIEELISKTEGLGVWGLIQFIMANNMQSAFVGMLFGIVLGVVPFSIVVVNGYVLGFVANKTVGVEGIFILWRLLPHGIFEIPAILISVGLGLRLGILLMYNCIVSSGLRRSGPWVIGGLMFLSILFFPITFLIYIVITFMNVRLRRKFMGNFGDSFRIFIFVVVPLLVIAGIIEGILIGLVG